MAIALEDPPARARATAVTKIRWVVWWPISYWYSRFDELACRPGVDLEVVFLSGSSQFYEEFPLDGVKFRYRFASTETSKSAFYKPSLALKDPLSLAGGDAKLIVNYADMSSALATLARRAKRQPYYLFVANSFRDSRSSSYLSDAAKRFMFQGAAGCLATGPFQMDYARHYGGATKPITEIGNPVDTSHFERQADRLLPMRDALRKSRGWQDRFVIGYVGRLAAEKSLSTVLTAASRLSKDGLRPLVALGGRGPEQSSLQDLGQKLGIELEFPGFLRDDDLCEFYASLDAFVLPSSSEPWGLVVNEAMHFELPVLVSTNVGAQHLIQPGLSGYVFPHGNELALADDLNALATDKKRREAIGKAARRRIAAETPARWADAVLRGIGTAS